MKTAKTLIVFWALLIMSTFVVFGQETEPIDPPKAAVLNVDAAGLVDDPTMLGNLLRLELQKLHRYQVMDKYDMKDLLSESDIDPMDCYSTRCLLEAGKILKVDKMITGNAETFLDKIIIKIKIVDVATGQIEAAEVGEYMMVKDELQNMLKLSLNDLLDIENDPMLVSNLTYYSVLDAPRSARIINNGPRMGFAYIGGNLATRLQAPANQGGYDAYPVISQLGLQYEVQYMGSGNFQALVEVIGLVGGLEQSMFIPSLVLLNGFRENKYGFEVGFGPSISMRKMASGYYDDQQVWHLPNEWPIDAGINPYSITEEVDSRGDPQVYTRWIWSVGKTFRSGHLNIPVNVFGAAMKKDWQVGLSIGFNLQKNRASK